MERRRARAVLPVFLSTERGQVEVAVRADEQIGPVRVRRVDVIHALAVAQETAQPVRLAVGEVVASSVLSGGHCR